MTYLDKLLSSYAIAQAEEFEGLASAFPNEPKLTGKARRTAFRKTGIKL